MNTPLAGPNATSAQVAPGTPVQVSPTNGVAITQQDPRVTLVWRTVTGASEYQVVVDDGRYLSPWLAGTNWTTPVLPAGQHVWQVRSRNGAGQSALSVKWLLFVNTSGVPSGQPSASASPSQGSGSPATGLTVLPTGGAATTTITIRGGGFNSSEPVRITLDTTSGPLLATTTAGADGSISTGIAIGNATRGVHTLIARGQTSGRQQSATYTVAPSLARSPINGPPGTVVTVTARGFAANEQVRLTWETATGPVLAELQTASNGTGTAGFPLPDAARGWHDYSGVGLTSGARAWGNVGIDPGLSLTAETATPGQSLTATARGFGASQPVTFTWNKSPASAGTTLCTIATNSTGRATCPITVPAGAGVFPVTASAPDGTFQSVNVQVGGGLSVSVTPASGTVGSSIQVSGGGFGANEAVDLRWDSGTTVTRVNASASGTVSRLMTVPFLANGAHTLGLQGQVSGRRASTTFTVGQSVALNPTGGPSGTRVTLSAQGMPASQSATAYWNRVSGSAGTALCSGAVSATGTFSCTITVPAATANTTYPLTLTAGGISAEAPFQVVGAGSGGPVGPPNGGNGTYVVNATREGLVGGTTSSGHVIQPFDRFVSLPACTASSCSWLTPGVAHSLWGIRTECGSACYVRIVNPANNRCIVAPIEDTGPWFTQDDWWNPTASRFLNTLSTNPNILRQGYPGAQAARDGLDVGYGVAPSGIGISNKGYEVGNTSAIDIGDGSWADLGFNIAGASAGGVTVTMLWQSGESPTAAARACGQSSANPPAGAGNSTGTPQASVTPTAMPRTPTATPRAPTATPRTPTATPLLMTATPRTPTGTPRTRKTPTPRVPTATTRPTTATPRPPTVAPTTPTATPRPPRVIRNIETSSTGSTGTSAASTPVAVVLFPTEGTSTATRAPRSPRVVIASEPPIIVASQTARPDVPTAEVIVMRPTASPTADIKPPMVVNQPTPPAATSAPQEEPTVTAPVIVAPTRTLQPTATREPALTEESEAAPEPDSTEIAAPPQESASEPSGAPTAMEEPTVSPTEQPTVSVTAEPTATPTEEFFEEPAATLPPEPVTQVLTLNPIGDTSVTSASPDDAQSPDQIGGLAFGGPEGAVSYLTFDVSTVVAPGDVVSATLTLTGTGPSGATGGELLAIPGAAVDEYGATWNTQPGPPGSAVDAYGSPVWIDWIGPGDLVTVDVTGTVSSSGVVTFVLIGLPDAGTTVGSRESGASPYLTIETVVYPGG